MNKAIIAVLCWAVGAVAPGQDLVFKDDFSGYAAGALPPETWAVIAGSGHWQIVGKQLIAAAEGGLCQLRKIPELDAVDYSAQLAIQARTNSTDWATAGIAILVDGHNHWRLNLVEGPDKRRYTEFGETYAGKWQAQSDGATRLRNGPGVVGPGSWDYAKTYLLRIRLSAQEMIGTVTEGDGGRLIANYHYMWDAAEGVKFGRPGFSVNGFSTAVSSVAITAPRVIAAGAPAVASGPAGRVALVMDLPGADRAVLATLEATLRKAGFGVTPLTCDELATPAVFSSMNFDCVVLAGSRFFPGKAKDNFLRFLRNGGHCVVLGGNVFAEAVAPFAGRWYCRADVERELAGEKPQTQLLDPARHEARAWHRGTDTPKSSSVVVVEDRGFRFDIKNLNGWDTFHANIAAPPPGQTLLCFRAKGDASTSQMTVEMDEQDGSRWIASVELTPQWTNYALLPDRFAQWEAKGEKKNGFTPGNATKLSFGLAANFNPRVAKGDHSFWVDGVGMASNRFGPMDFARKVDLNIFSDYEPYRLANVVAVGMSPGNKITPAAPPLQGDFGGLAAIGFAFPNESTFFPLLSTLDQYGRDCGWACGMLVNYGGTYRGSSWIFCGIADRAFYAAPAVLDTITAAMKAALGGSLAQTARADSELPKQTDLAVVAPAPQGFIHLSPDGKHLIYPDGRRFFMSGCNYVGPFDCCGGRLWRDEFFSVARVEEDFRKAHYAGLNCMRYWVSSIDRDIMRGDFRKVEVIRQCARKYGVYLLLDLPGTSCATVEEMVASHQAIAKAFQDEPMVIGYDLRNEPYLGTVAGIRYSAAGRPPVLTTDFLAKHGDLISARLVREAVQQRPEWLHLPHTVHGQDAENATAAILLWAQYARKHQIETSTATGLAGDLPEDEQYADVVAAADQSFALWARLQIEAIRAVDTNHLITIGYDTALVGLPSNRQLDFISQHVYARPYGLPKVMENVTMLDRLAAVWPGKPITLGEFGYSTGIPMTDGYLDRYTASVGEMIHYLYAFTHNYDGVKKWMLNDWPYQIMQHYGDWNKGDATRRYEERFGLYYYDGTPSGRPKPIVHALRFFGDHIARVAPSGTLEIVPAPLSIGAGYVYKNEQALFIGNTAYASDRLVFSAQRPANVMLRWDTDGLRVMASADAQVKIKPAAFGPFGKNVTGNHGALRAEGEALVIELLEGETLLFK
jgi:hypothetical protein